MGFSAKIMTFSWQPGLRFADPEEGRKTKILSFDTLTQKLNYVRLLTNHPLWGGRVSALGSRLDFEQKVLSPHVKSTRKFKWLPCVNTVSTDGAL